MPEIIVGDVQTRTLAPGVVLDPVKPGGRNGPNGEVLRETPGGQTWIYEWMLGDKDDAFQLSVPDIRFPANQYWPLHWHNCWVAVILLDGQCLVGDWWMQPGDVLIARADLEYGPVVVGPSGCQMFEIFAQSHLRQGGYAREYADHPTLSGTGRPFNFVERSALNQRNQGRQVLPNGGVDGLYQGRLEPGAVFNLGEPDDPDRGVMLYTQMDPGETIPPHRFDDARIFYVFEGEVSLDGETLGKGAAVNIERQARVGELVAGPNGAQLLEVTRTSRGLERRAA